MNENMFNLWAAERLAKKNECRIKDINLASIKIEKVFEAAEDCPEGEDSLCNCVYSHDEYSAVHISAKTMKPAGGYGYLDLFDAMSVEDYEKVVSQM